MFLSMRSFTVCVDVESIESCEDESTTPTLRMYSYFPGENRFLELDPGFGIFVSTSRIYFSTIDFLPLNSIYWWWNSDLSNPILVSSYSTSLGNNSCPIFRLLTVDLNPLIWSIFLWHPSTLSKSSFAVHLMILVSEVYRRICDNTSI